MLGLELLLEYIRGPLCVPSGKDTTHNICELMGDECQEEWIDTTLETDRLEVASNATSTASTAAGAIRDAFADYFV